MASIIQNITNEIHARLANITKANGYEFDVGTIEKPNRDVDGWNPGPFGISVEKGEEVENEEQSYPGNPPRVAFDVPFVIDGFARRLDLDECEIGVNETSTTENEMARSIKKALANNDAASWHTFGGNAIDAHFATTSDFDHSEWDGARVALVITYRVSELDPAVAG